MTRRGFTLEQPTSLPGVASLMHWLRHTCLLRRMRARVGTAADRATFVRGVKRGTTTADTLQVVAGRRKTRMALPTTPPTHGDTSNAPIEFGAKTSISLGGTGTNQLERTRSMPGVRYHDTPRGSMAHDVDHRCASVPPFKGGPP